MISDLQNSILVILAIVFVTVAIAFLNNKMLFLIAGFDKDSLSKDQIQKVAISVARLFIVIGILMLAEFIRENSSFKDEDTTIFYIAFGLSFGISLLFTTITMFQVNREISKSK